MYFLNNPVLWSWIGKTLIFKFPSKKSVDFFGVFVLFVYFF